MPITHLTEQQKDSWMQALTSMQEEIRTSQGEEGASFGDVAPGAEDAQWDRWANAIQNGEVPDIVAQVLNDFYQQMIDSEGGARLSASGLFAEPTLQVQGPKGTKGTELGQNATDSKFVN